MQGTHALLLTLALRSCGAPDRVLEESTSSDISLFKDLSLTLSPKYNAFWENPAAASVSWLGLLYSISCVSLQIQSKRSLRSRPQNNELPGGSPTASFKILGYREKVVQCLVRAQFAKGGPDILESLFHYLLIENYLNRDSDIGLWLLMGNIVQIGTSSANSLSEALKERVRVLCRLGRRAAEQGVDSYPHGLPPRPGSFQVSVPVPARDEAPNVGYGLLTRHRVFNSDGPSEHHQAVT